MSEPSATRIQPEQPAPPRSRDLILALSGLAALSGVLIVLVYQWTLPVIKAAKAEALKKSVFEVIPEARQVKTFRLEKDGSLALLTGEDEKAVKFYAGYDPSGGLKGIAIEARGQGFQDVIQVIYGYDPGRQVLTGMRVLESKETPGLGDKIGNDPAFLENFTALEVQLNNEGRALKNPIVVVKKGQKQKAWEMDSITGATISSKAIGKMLNQSAGEQLPRIRRNLKRLEEGK